MRPGVLVTLIALLGTLGLVSPVAAGGTVPDTAITAGTASTASAASTAGTDGVARPTQDPRRTRGLFVDPRMPGANHGQPYASAIGRYAQALWIIPEAYGTSRVRDDVRAYTSRALKAHKTPTLSIYGIPGRDCGQYSSGNPLTTAAQYRAWIKQVTKGLQGQRAIVILEPDALALFSSPVETCPTKPAGWQGMLRFASKRLSTSGAWVYLDAGHSNWTPYDTRPAYLKASGVQFARGISTNVSNFRPTADEKSYAQTMLAGLKALGITGKHYVVDTSRNGVAPGPSDGYDVLNPRWARVGAAPRLRFDGAFDGTLWVKHPGESDGTVNDGPPSGQWCDRLADRLLGRADSGHC